MSARGAAGVTTGVAAPGSISPIPATSPITTTSGACPCTTTVGSSSCSTLEGAQAGLSWETILNKRDGYRQLFAGFDPARVARFTARDVQRLLRDPAIVRHEGKIRSTIGNARALLALQRELGSFDRFVWGFVGGTPLRRKEGGSRPGRRRATR